MVDACKLKKAYLNCACTSTLFCCGAVTGGMRFKIWNFALIMILHSHSVIKCMLFFKRLNVIGFNIIFAIGKTTIIYQRGQKTCWNQYCSHPPRLVKATVQFQFPCWVIFLLTPEIPAWCLEFSFPMWLKSVSLSFYFIQAKTEPIQQHSPCTWNIGGERQPVNEWGNGANQDTWRGWAP